MPSRSNAPPLLEALPELKVHAAADDAFVQRHGCGRARAIHGAARLVAEINEQIFDLRGPVRREGVFDADASRPSGLRRTTGCTGGSLDISESNAPGAAEHHPVPSPGGTAPHRGEPIALRLAAKADT